jgi:hypothetical protein
VSDECKIYKLMLGVMVTPVMRASRRLKQEAAWAMMHNLSQKNKNRLKNRLMTLLKW